MEEFLVLKYNINEYIYIRRVYNMMLIDSVRPYKLNYMIIIRSSPNFYTARTIIYFS